MVLPIFGVSIIWGTPFLRYYILGLQEVGLPKEQSEQTEQPMSKPTIWRIFTH